MKVFLTGLPKSGKSTMLADLIADLHPKHGLFSPEVRENGERIGFNLLDADGNTAIFSRVGTPSDYPVGRYYVDLVSLERFIEPLFKHTDDQLLFIDEVGQMQLYSEHFKNLTKDYLQAPNDFIGTVSQVYEHPFINELKQNKDILLCTVTPENRQQLKAGLVEVLNHRVMFNQLPKTTQNNALDFARGYLESEQYTSLKKLFKNAIPSQ
jgi:nucleoside-triphosphatase